MTGEDLDQERARLAELQPEVITVLIIEDTTTVCQETTDKLMLEGFSLLYATDGATGLMVAQEAHPDIIICDLSIPELDGFTVLMYLRQETVTASIPFIFLTAKADRSSIRRGMELGADDYLTKPFTDRELLGALKARIERKKALSHGNGDH